MSVWPTNSRDPQQITKPGVLESSVSTEGAGPQERGRQKLDKAVLIHSNMERKFYVCEPIIFQICSGPWERELPRVAVL